MGDRQLGKVHGNPSGHFEDQDFLFLNDTVVHRWNDPIPLERISPALKEGFSGMYKKLVEKREGEHELWGVKDPRLCFTLPMLLDCVPQDARIIWTHRSLEACIKSMAARDKMPEQGAARICQMYENAKMEQLEKIGCPKTGVDYDQLIEKPASVIEMIGKLVFEDMDPPPEEAVQDALKHVDPELRHWKGGTS